MTFLCSWPTHCFIQHTCSPRPVFALSVARLRLVRRLVFASPVFALSVAPFSPRPSPRFRLARRPVFASPVAPSSPRGRPVISSSLWYRWSGSAVLPNGLYAMGGTVAQAVWLKVDRRGNVPVGTFPFSML
ncbi:hypothetical protein OUZ56_024950 [Daphnia magna]|uniref:Uncharacterized protein n=1 Tax=Daphnia magna TaxID=35525 RepID=A0ABQ9ZIF2_9CRUS|nr:hypothetical protein OUZ56_024940 [Daphnia magna]KAK4012714.1 hypothetical protein OUZ56_024950 [Daphnia magna]